MPRDHDEAGTLSYMLCTHTAKYSDDAILRWLDVRRRRAQPPRAAKRASRRARLPLSYQHQVTCAAAAGRSPELVHGLLGACSPYGSACVNWFYLLQPKYTRTLMELPPRWLRRVQLHLLTDTTGTLWDFATAIQPWTDSPLPDYVLRALHPHAPSFAVLAIACGHGADAPRVSPLLSEGVLREIWRGVGG
jgi:hypothetical protein